jgi:site-specific DNA-methyltransferase (cytosine-N4-specific)
LFLVFLDFGSRRRLGTHRRLKSSSNIRRDHDILTLVRPEEHLNARRLTTSAKISRDGEAAIPVSPPISLQTTSSESVANTELPVGPAYHTAQGQMFKGRAEEILTSQHLEEYAGKVQLIFTSPPFPLNRKKRYGNKTGAEYVLWLARMAPLFTRMLAPNGSIVIEMGNAWEAGRPVMSMLALRALLAFMKRGRLNMCQQFICDNPARLPGPVQWVNRERIRVKDSFTHVWWMSPVERPKADNRRVLKPYSKAMKKLLIDQNYNAGRRPSQWLIGETSFLADNGGAIPSNYLSFANTRTNDAYQQHCRALGIKPHPARMPIGLADFFVNFLTEPGDVVLDPFAGSNTTGQSAEQLGRRWLAIEARDEYIMHSRVRFQSTQNSQP